MSYVLSRRAAMAALAGTFGEAPVVYRFKETNDVFANPHRGFMGHPVRGGRPRAPRFASSVQYLRTDWAVLEPAEGNYDWSVIDNALAAAPSMRLSLRIMTANAHSGGMYSSPKWLFDAGCRSFEYLVGGDDPTSGGKRIPRVEPDYTDPLYLEKHTSFLRALAARYDTHPGMEFADIGSYGIWGEWHTKHPAPFEARRRIIDAYVKNFRQMPLVFMSDDAEGLDYALSQGAGYRRDGVGSPWHAQNWIGSKKYVAVNGFDTAWRRAPVVFEWYGDWKYMQQRKWSFADSVRFMLDNHATFINDNIGAVPEEDMPLLAELDRRAGYRFVLREAGCAGSRGEVTVRMQWSNVGVAPIYRRYVLELALIGADGKVAARTEAADTRQWLPGDHTVEAKLKAKRGAYTLTASIRSADGSSTIRLACDAPEENLRYRIGEVRVG